MLGVLETALKEAGLDDQVERLREVFGAEFLAASEDFTHTTGRAAPLGGFAKEGLKAFEDDRLDLGARLINQYVGDVRSAIMDQVILGQPPSVTLAQNSAGDAVMHHLRTELNTSVMTYQRIIHKQKAEKAGIDKFLYVGPDDKITRPFCHEHVGKIYSSAEIAEMDNEQDLPVEIFCGGYNCRHHWRPVSDRLAKKLQEANDGEES